jgi:chromosome partitioning protein
MKVMEQQQKAKIVGVVEIAALANVSRQAVHQWLASFPDFPRPLRRLSCGLVFDEDEVVEWLRKHRVKVA